MNNERQDNKDNILYFSQIHFQKVLEEMPAQIAQSLHIYSKLEVYYFPDND